MARGQGTMPGDGQELGCVPMLPPGSLSPRWCKAAGRWPTTTHGLRGPAPRPLALFDRGSGLQKEPQVYNQDSVCCGV